MFNLLKKIKPADIERQDNLLDKDSPFALVEAFRNIKTNLSFCVPKADGRKAKVITVCSSVPAEGKSTVAVNLAISCATEQDKCVLIDADLRLPRINKFIGKKNDNGLSQYLCGQADLDAIVKKTDYTNLDVIFSGFRAPNPNVLLSDRRFDELIAALSEKYDYIILDTPPLASVSDCLLIAPKTDGALIVTKHMETTHPLLQGTIGKLEFANCNILGIVLNQYKMPKQRRYYKSGKSYYVSNYYSDN